MTIAAVCIDHVDAVLSAESPEADEVGKAARRSAAQGVSRDETPQARQAFAAARVGDEVVDLIERSFDQEADLIFTAAPLAFAADVENPQPRRPSCRGGHTQSAARSRVSWPCNFIDSRTECR